jgi:predicted DNA-binding protein with PD1-like motif
MIAQSAACARMVAIRLNSGDDILISLREAVKQTSIQNGLIVSGIGSIKRYHYHVVETTNLPPGDTYLKGEGAFDILTLTGAIMDGRVHAHITFSDTEKAQGGHLEEGSEILTFGLIVLADAPELDLTDWDRMGQLA